MGKRIVIIQGHPDRDQKHLGYALGAAYREAATAAGHEVSEFQVAQLDFPLLRTVEEWRGPVPESLREAQAALKAADHWVIIFPLWTGTMPALLKGFFEQVARPGFAFKPRPDGKGLAPQLTGKSARMVVTLGMPAFWFRWAHGAMGVRGFQRSFLELAGIKPVRTTYIGSVDAKGFAGDKWLAQLRELGARGE